MDEHLKGYVGGLGAEMVATEEAIVSVSNTHTASGAIFPCAAAKLNSPSNAAEKKVFNSGSNPPYTLDP